MFCILDFVFRVFDFRLLSFMFCISACMCDLAPPRRTRKMNVSINIFYCIYIASNGVGPQVLPTTHDTKHKSKNPKLESQKFETQNSKHPYTKHNVHYCHFYRFLFTSPSCCLTTQDTKHRSQNTKLESQKFETQNPKHPYTSILTSPFLSLPFYVSIAPFNVTGHKTQNPKHKI